MPYDGLTAEQEEYQERCSRAQLAGIIYKEPSRHRFFSKQLLKFADPHFRPSPPDSPWRPSKKRPRTAPARSKPPQTDPSSASEEEEEESRNLADMAPFWEEEDDDH